jgi:hypothetical protein
MLPRPTRAILALLAAGSLLGFAGVATIEVTGAEAAVTYVYKPNTRWACSGCLGIGRDRNNYENWMRVSDCGGVFNNNCNHEVWEQNVWGNRYYTTYGNGDDVWVGRYHQTRYPGTPVCRSNYGGQATLGYCYQGYGY